MLMREGIWVAASRPAAMQARPDGRAVQKEQPSQSLTCELPPTEPSLPPPNTLPTTSVLPESMTEVLPSTLLSSPPPKTLPVVSSPSVPILLSPSMVR